MNVRPAELAQPVVKIGPVLQTAVPNMDAALASESAHHIGALPLLALSIAIIATVVWNGFLLWEAATLVFSWMGF